MAKNCGNCKHFECDQFHPNGKKGCFYPMPDVPCWVDLFDYPGSVIETDGEDCPCFSPSHQESKENE